MLRQYVVCSNPSCKFSAEGYEETIKSCPFCAGKLVYKCPACGEYIRRKGTLFCEMCSAPLKAKPEQGE